jgi:hypothetical protein
MSSTTNKNIRNVAATLDRLTYARIERFCEQAGFVRDDGSPVVASGTAALIGIALADHDAQEISRATVLAVRNQIAEQLHRRMHGLIEQAFAELNLG